MTSLAHSTYIQTRSIGGSDAAAVMGVSRYKTPAQVYDAITGPSGPRPAAEGGPQERGQVIEPIIAQLYARKTGFHVREAERVLSERHPFLHASPDRLVVAPGRSGEGVLEIKSHSGFVARDVGEHGIPYEYYVQIQHYLFVLGLAWADYAYLDYDAWDVKVISVPRDEQTIATIVDRCTTFWLDYVEKGIRPPETILQPEPEERRWPVGRPGAPKTREDAPWVSAVSELQGAVEAAKIAEQRLKLAQDAVKTLMGEDEEIAFPGGKVTWKESTSRSMDGAALRADHPEIDFTKYERVKATRTFRPTFGKGGK